MKKIRVLVLSSLLAHVGLQACFVTVYNDTNEAVQLFNLNDSEDEGVYVEPGSSTVFGDKQTRAHFVLARKHDGYWEKELHIKRAPCHESGTKHAQSRDLELRVSAIIDRKADERYFEINSFDEKNAPEAGSKNAKLTCSCMKK